MAVHAPTARNLFLFLLAVLALESAGSIRFLYTHFLSKISDKSLNTFYYVCSYANIDYSRFMNITTSIALNLIPGNLGSQPVFLCIDDTMVSKSGKKFEDVSKLFDHAAHNGSNYLNEHCFVRVMLCVPVWSQNRIRYVFVPLGYHSGWAGNPNGSWLHQWCSRSCWNLPGRKMLSSCVTTGMLRKTLCVLWMNTKTLTLLAMSGLTL